MYLLIIIVLFSLNSIKLRIYVTFKLKILFGINSIDCKNVKFCGNVEAVRILKIIKEKNNIFKNT